MMIFSNLTVLKEICLYGWRHQLCLSQLEINHVNHEPTVNNGQKCRAPKFSTYFINKSWSSSLIFFKGRKSGMISLTLENDFNTDFH